MSMMQHPIATDQRRQHLYFAERKEMRRLLRKLEAQQPTITIDDGKLSIELAGEVFCFQLTSTP